MLFAALLCVSSAAPVIADPTAPPAEEVSAPLPTSEEIRSALIRAEAEAGAAEAKLEEELATPEAVHEREVSRTAYGDISTGEAQNLLLEQFPEQLEALNADPGRVLTGLSIEKTLGPNGALVANGAGESAIIESSVPVESELRGEDKAPVDLELEREGGAFTPANPLTGIELPVSADGQIRLENGVEVQLPTSDAHAGEQLGGMNIFYPETEPTTDSLVSPLAGGVELSEQLRSPQSPEQFRFKLSLPPGGTISPRGDGGAEVLSASGDQLEELPPPSAVDAQGRQVPATMAIEGDSLVIGVPHRSLEVAYPILLDPSLWDTPAFTSGEWGQSASGGPYDLWNEGSALHVASRGWQVYEPNTYAQFVYVAPGTSAFIEEANFSNISFFTGDNGTNGCGVAQPHGYVGIFNVATGSYTSPGAGEFKGGNSFTPTYTAKNGGLNVRDAMVGIGNGGAQIWIKCNHEMFVGGVTLKESDPDNPWIKSVSGVPSGWFDPQKAGSATIVAADSGFGVHDISIYDGAGTNHAGFGCSGVSGSRCSGEKSWTIPPPYQNGERTLEVFAEDPLGHTGKWTTTTKVDNQAPDVELSGQLAQATEEEGKKGAENEASENKLSFPVYNLQIKATDGNESPSAPAYEKQSGVRNIEIYLDGVKQEVPWAPQGCASYSCKMEGTYQLKLLGLTAGEHKLKVVAEDQVVHHGNREIEFEYIPATGISDEYVTQHFPLPDGEGNESEEENPVRPELAVNVMNGNLVFRQQDIEVTGPGTDLEVERVYNSQLPKAQNTEWGAGWTLAQTPELEIEEPKTGPPTDATMVEENGAVEGSVNLPTTIGEEKFDKEIQAVVTKEPHGYEVVNESGETDGAVAFNEAGEATELRTPGSATVEIESNSGALSELAVNDPGTAGGQAERSSEEPVDPYIYALSFGGKTSGPGNLAAPVDTATDAEGDVWVADAGHNRIQEFNSKGEFVRQFGAKGTGNGEFGQMQAIAVDAAGDVWVSCSSDNRLQEFNSKGEFLRQLTGSTAFAGQFAGLTGLAVDPEGHLWTLESMGSGKPRLQEFTAEGTYIKKLEFASGKEAGQLSNPQALAIDPGGNFWIADTANNRIEEFNSKGEYLRTSGSEGSGNGQFRSPKGIATDAAGNVWVADTANNRIESFSSNGSYLGQFGKAGDNNGQFAEPKGLTLDAKGDVWVADTVNNRVEEIAAGEYVRQFGGEGSGPGNLAAPVDTATDAEGNVWVADAGHNRIQEFDSKGEFVRQFGAKGTGNGEFTSMQAIAVDPAGNLWVAAGNRVQEFNSKGEYLRQFSGSTAFGGQFSGLSGIATDPEGHLWTLESYNELSGKARLQEFSPEGAFLAKSEIAYGSAAGQLKSPQALAIDPAGNVWVADTSNNRIEEFNAKGEYLRASGSEGSGNGQFKSPRGIATDTAGNVWVADTGNNRIQELSPGGVYLAQFGKAGDNNGQFSEPKGLTLDAKGNIWIADTANNRIEEISGGAYLRQAGGEASGPGNLAAPVDTATDAEGDVWVADAGHNRIQEFNSKGEFVRQFGATGTGNGQFTAMHALTFDAKGNLYVAAASRVQEFNAKGEYIRQWGTLGSGNGQFEGLAGVAIDPEGHVWTLESYNEFSGKPRLQEFSSEGAYMTKLEFAVGKEAGQLSNPQALAIDPGGNIWIADTSNNRIEEFGPKGQFLRASGSEGSGNGQFKLPKGIATDAEGNVWVADTAHNRIEEFSPNGVYLAQFGKAGDNTGQFAEPKGLTLDAKGDVWVADTVNNRVERWHLAGWSSTYLNPGSITGEAGGQLVAPASLAVDKEGNLWIADTGHNRIEEFSSQGELVRQFGSEGSADGLFKEPRAIAIDSAGNVWVADRGNNRVQEFNSKGEFVRRFGAAGTGNGQFGRLQGIATDAEGHIWTIEWGTEMTGKPRVQEFTPEGVYLAQFGSAGTGAGQFKEPQGIAVDAKGNVWVADAGNQRVEEFSSKAQFLWKFGAKGSEEGQLSAPTGLVPDKEGNLWVVDAGNDTVSEFSSEGIFLRQFGTAGNDDGQLSSPEAVVFDQSGNLWVADTGNNRVEEWLNTSLPPEPPAPEPDPSVKVATSSGLVSSVEGKAAGVTTYSHSVQQLTAVSGTRGNTTYEYDASGRLKKVSLPKGTWGEIKYDSVGRVASVKVSIEGAAAKTTYFAYSEQPRRTTVTPEVGQAVTYEFAADGSVFKWWNSAKAPTIEPLEGSLWYQRGEVHPDPISPGDQTLTVLAKSSEGIASIQIVANGDQLVAEKTCEQNWEVEGIECQKEEKTFVTETENWSPGILQLEVIVTDRNGLIESRRFWDNVPYTPQPNPEEITPPTFEDIKKFREEFGLDLDIQGSEQAINERIFQLIADWHDAGSPVGEAARASAERWGVPLRPADIAEMEYREWYLEVDGPLIEEWSQSHYPESYSGYEVNHAAGGIIRLGFTEAQKARVKEFIQQVNPSASNRITTFSSVPTRPLASLEDLEDEVVNAMNSDSILKSTLASVEIGEGGNVITVDATDVAEAEARLRQLFGTQNQLKVVGVSGVSEPLLSRERKGGRILGGDWVWTDWTPTSSPLFTRGSAGFGVVEDKYIPQENKVLHIRFLLDAGHMGNTGTFMYREANGLYLSEQERREKGEKIGRVGRDAFWEGERAVDALATRLNGDGLAPYKIFGYGSVGPARIAWKGEPLCASGAYTGHIECGRVVGFKQSYLEQDQQHTIGEIFVKGLKTHRGDSGSPVWNPRTGASVGMISAHPHPDSQNCEVQPLLTMFYGHNKQKRLVGALGATVMGSGSLHLIQGG